MIFFTDISEYNIFILEKERKRESEYNTLSSPADIQIYRYTDISEYNIFIL